MTKNADSPHLDTVQAPPKKPYPPVVVVDEHDNEIGSAMLTEVWRKGLCHRIVTVFVIDDQGRMLLQLRDAAMELYPNCWDQAAAGHVDIGYSYERAARTEIEEEIGLQSVSLQVLGTNFVKRTYGGRRINQFVRVYRIRVASDVTLKPGAGEVAELKWFSPAELKQQLLDNPEIYTPGLKHDLKTYFSDLFS